MNAQASISLDHVDKILGKAKRVDDLSLELAAGKIYGLLGPNGSGKTTILHLICGLYKPDRGTIRVLGMDPVRDHKAVRSAIGLLPQSTALYPELSARENLRFHAALYLPKGADAEARISETLQLVDLEARADEPVKNYSGGMSQRWAWMCRARTASMSTSAPSAVQARPSLWRRTSWPKPTRSATRW